MQVQLFNLQGLNEYVNPFQQTQGELLRAINVKPEPLGALSKRGGYVTFAGTTNGSVVQNIFQVSYNAGAQDYLYAKKGNVLQFYDVTAGTGDWVTCGNGTFSGTTYIGHSVLENTLIVGDGVGSTRHTTNGTAFTDTTLAPIAKDFEQYQQRIYAAGTADTVFFSTTGDATNWSGAGTADSSSFQVPGEQGLKRITKIADKLNIFKEDGNIFRWDGDYLIDGATDAGIVFPQTLSKFEDYAFWLNWIAIYGSGGSRPELLSNSITNTIKLSTPGNSQGIVFDRDYYLSFEELIDPISKEEILGGVVKYNIQKNMYHIYSQENLPESFGVLTDNVNKQHLLFGDDAGQVYKYTDALSDNGLPISSVIELLVHAGAPEDEKQWNRFTAFFNPGSRAKIQIGTANTFNRDNLKLIDLGDTSTGYVNYRFPQGTNSNLLFIRIYERSGDTPFIWYGGSIDCELSPRR